MGWGRNQITRQRESLALYKSLNTLWDKWSSLQYSIRRFHLTPGESSSSNHTTPTDDWASRSFYLIIWISVRDSCLVGIAKAVGGTRDRWIEAWIEGEAFFSDSSSFLELDKVFKISQKLELDLAEYFFKNYLDRRVRGLQYTDPAPPP